MLFIIVVAVCLASATADSSESSEEHNFFGTPIHFGHSAVFGNENEEQNSGIVGTPLSLEKEEVFGGGISGEGIVGTPSHLEEEAVFGGPGEMEEENPVFVGTPLHLEEEAVFGGPGEMEEENPVIVGTPLHLEEEAVFGGPGEMKEENPVIVGTPLHLEEENALRGPGEIPEEPEETSNEQYTIETLLELKKVFQLSDVNDNGVLEEHEVNSIVRRGDINNDGQLSEQELLLDPATKLSPSTFPIFDFNSDGRITLEDVRVAFSKLKQLSDGDAITFKNFVELFGHKLPAEKDSKMNIQTFLILEQNFEISDLDDDRVVSQEEYTTVFRLADENRNGLIHTDELFIPTRHIDTTHFCVTACTEQKLNNLFSILDINMDGKLTFPEYKWLSERVGAVFQAVNVAVLLVFPATVIYILHPNPIFSVVSLGAVTVVFLKLVSYACVNKWCRDAIKEEKTSNFRRRKTVSVSEEAPKISNGEFKSKLVTYPDNLNYKDLYYFMFAPTLIYELNFPRSVRIRKRFLVKRIFEMIFLSQLMLALTQQWIIPTVNNAMKPLAELAIYRVVERLLKLAIPNHFIWLIFFYWFFHSSLNVLAEVLRFADREFYRDWWNADTVSRFWQDWNIPVHRWATRHLYKPLVRRGCSRVTGSIAVFLLSAFFHEYLLSVPLRMFKVWAFSAMIGQVPLAFITSKNRHLQGTVGNIIMWLSLIMGQPIAILAYVHDYYIINYPTLTNQTMPLV